MPLLLYSMAAGAVAFFGYSAYHGSRGIVAKREYKIKIAKLGQDLAALQAERGDWERRINLMRADSLDLDILEERSRLILNSSHKNDVILILNDKP
ncbi:MAG: septum formation initiator family protein [Beijerinckiaceae bacterium]|nr:septum formation initiator family protein [Beijerinckiaceae bacterium]